MKRRIRTFFLWLLAIAVCAALIIPWPVSRQISAVMIKLDDPDFGEPVTVELDGKYYLNLFSCDEYWGYFRISNDEMTQNYPITFNIAIGADYEESLVYRFNYYPDSKEYKLSGNELGRYESGRILSKRFLRKLCIEIPERPDADSESYAAIEEKRGYVIVTEESDPASALRLLEDHYGELLNTPESLKTWPYRIKYSHETYLTN